MTAQWAPGPDLPSRHGSRVGGIVLVVIGCLLGLLTLGLLGGGSVLMWANQTQRDASGYLTTGTDRLSGSGYALASTNVDISLAGRGWSIGEGSARQAAHHGDRRFRLRALHRHRTSRQTRFTISTVSPTTS